MTTDEARVLYQKAVASKGLGRVAALVDVPAFALHGFISGKDRGDRDTEAAALLLERVVRLS